MKKTILLLILFIGIASLTAQNDKRFNGVEKQLNELMEISNAPGFSVAVVEKDKVVFASGFGYRDYENQIFADANTLYAIGSTTKAFTSALLGTLRDDKKISFDDPPSKYIPELKFYNDEMNNNIIIKDLMSHRTGLPRHDLSWYLFPSNNRDSLIKRIQHMEPFTGVREQYYYNNFMFMLQGAIAERITEKSWEDNIRERFFQPLEMDRSKLRVDELKDLDNVAFGYALKNDSIIEKQDYYRIEGMSPAGSIYSSVNDLANWLIAWINKGKFKAEQIIPESYISEAMTSQMVMRSGLPNNEFPDMHFANYGYGWTLNSYSGHYRVSHGGNIDGFSALLGFFPTDSVGIVVLTNQNGSALPSVVLKIMSDRMLNIKDRDWVALFREKKEEAEKSRSEAKTEEKTQIYAKTKPSHILQEFTGTYHNPGYGTFDVSNNNDSLFAHLKLMKLWLKHLHYNVFEPYEIEDDGSIDTTGGSPLKFNFIANSTGDIAYMETKIEPTVDPIKFKRTPIIMEVSAADLEKYTGNYTLMGTNIKIYIEDEILFLLVQGQPAYELIATDKNKFSFKALEGFKVDFKEETDGSIKEALLIQPHGNYTIVKSE